MRYLPLLLLPLALTACGDDPNSPKPQVRVAREFEIDGCEVKYVIHPSLPNFYIARCSGTVTNTWQRQNGKATTTEATINIESADILRKKLAEAEAKEKALGKLTEQEKKLLGVR